MELSPSGSQPVWWIGVGNTSVNLISAAASVRFGFLLRTSFKKLSHLYRVPRLKGIWCRSASEFEGVDFVQLSGDVFARSCSKYLHFFSGGGDIGKSLGIGGASNSESSRRNSLNNRKWTNVLLGINILVFVAQMATQGKLLLWGAKINSLIDKGQFWRLLTSSVLHANVGHLMVNCYSLNSIGPSVENLIGPRRFLAVYFASAIASSTTSYWFCKAPAVGASGAVFGLVGSFAVFVLRHRGMIRGGGAEDLKHIARVILLNMVIGVLSRGIDNWGHIGGLVGGAMASWIVGPAWRYESLANDGRRIIVDRAPIKYLTNRIKGS
ncbi:RHOMBOID-like protein 10 [Euphorbia peplus]|nr:RHOMBOID-like protein 10 [Euphorbia peplus]